MNKKTSTEALLRFFILFVLSAMALSVLVPVFWVISASLKTDSQFYGSPWSLPYPIDLKNFAEAWNEANMGTYFMNSVTVTVLSMAILLITAIPCAYAISRFPFFGKGFVRTLFMAGLFINASYLVVPIFLMFTGIDSLLPSPILINNKLVLSVVYASCSLPFTVYLLSGYFKDLPAEYEEAAYVDGASRLRTMVQVIVPMARPALITVILFNFLTFWNEYIIAITLMTDDAQKTLPVGLMNLMKAQNAAAQYGRMYAGLVIVMVPTLVLYIIVQKKLTEGLSLGGVKG